MQAVVIAIFMLIIGGAIGLVVWAVVRKMQADEARDRWLEEVKRKYRYGK